jgi:hypothetical protein
MSKKNKKDPDEAPSSVSVDPDKRGCAVSFLTGERNEMDKVCGGIQTTETQEYVQPDEEKESGGEA